jgi:uncharacterized protein involved in exopolysaccharide biosynthesis
MEQRPDTWKQEETIDLGKYLVVLRSEWKKIFGISLAVGLLALGYQYTKPNIYQSSATITPAEDQMKQSPALGAFASLGVSIGGPTKLEDLEALFKSDDLTVRVFKKYNLWPVVSPGSFDSKTGLRKRGWLASLFGGKGEKSPSDWDAIRYADGNLTIATNKKMGTLEIAFESPSPEGSASIVRYYLEEAKSRLQEEAFDRAGNNKKFIQEQIGKTVDALTRDRLYALYGQEMEREMLARNREQFGFTVLDSPRIPDRRTRPRRGSVALGIFLVTAFLAFRIVLHRKRKDEADTASR